MVLSLPHSIQQALSRAVDIVLPPHSIISGDLKGDGESRLWGDIRFLDEPCCAQCGFPFDYDVGLGSVCGDCAARSPAYDRARAAFVYNDASRRMILSFKHGGRTEGLDVFAAQMRRAGRQFWDEADYLVPVPLHPTRLIKRRFNQSALLARRLAKTVKPDFEADILFRSKATPSQGLQTFRGRFRNVKGVFYVPENARAHIHGKRIVLVDDVMTTGATIGECAKALKRAGASYIDVVTLARTVRDKAGPNGENYAKD